MTAPDRAEADVAALRRIEHDEAMALTEVENARLLSQLRALNDEHWSLPTDCTGWDARAVAVHLIASAEAQASPVEFLRQVWTGRTLTAEVGGSHWVDGVNEAQLRARRTLSTTELPARWECASTAALRARRRMPAPVRRLRLLPLGEALGTDLGWQPLGYLFGIGFTRDVWMHRVDVARAVGLPLELTADHDGRLVADIVAEWAALHDEPFALDLHGPAGGTYRARGGAEPVRLDAVEFCRVLSGRAPGHGVLSHALPL